MNIPKSIDLRLGIMIGLVFSISTALLAVLSPYHDVPEKSWWGEYLGEALFWPGTCLLDWIDKFYFLPRSLWFTFSSVIAISFIFWFTTLRVSLIPFTRKSKNQAEPCH